MWKSGSNLACGLQIKLRYICRYFPLSQKQFKVSFLKNKFILVIWVLLTMVEFIVHE